LQSLLLLSATKNKRLDELQKNARALSSLVELQFGARVLQATYLMLHSTRQNIDSMIYG